MKISKFTEELSRNLDSVQHPTILRDGNVAEENLFPGTQTTEYIGYLVNLAVRHLHAGEIHLQVGGDCRRALTYALQNNRDQRHYLFTNLSTQERAEFISWMQKHDSLVNVHLFTGDPLEFLAMEPSVLPSPIGVFYYHGVAEYEAVKMTLRLVEPQLADRAVLILNDTNWAEPNRACQEWLEETPQAEMLLNLPTFANCYPTWWNGIQVLAYRRGGFQSIFKTVWNVFG